jgi:hypothetical protein
MFPSKNAKGDIIKLAALKEGGSSVYRITYKED